MWWGRVDSDTDLLDTHGDNDSARRRDPGARRGKAYQMPANAPVLDAADQPDSAQTTLVRIIGTMWQRKPQILVDVVYKIPSDSHLASPMLLLVTGWWKHLTSSLHLS